MAATGSRTGAPRDAVRNNANVHGQMAERSAAPTAGRAVRLPAVRLPAVRPPAPRPSPLIDSDVAWFVLINIALISAMWVRHGGLADLGSTSSKLVAVGQLCGLFGTFAILGQLVLISRVPWLERRYGMDNLNHWHRWNGFAATWLLIAHAVTITLGYASGSRLGIWSQLHDFVFNYPDVLMAMVGLSAIIAVAVTSIRAARKALRYETWWFVHLYAYLGVALAFAHQLAVGTDFVDDPWARIYWVGLYVTTAVVLFGWRLVGPMVAATRHRLRVADVVPEGPGVVTIVLSGRRLDRLAAAGGQFFILRFMRTDRWWKAHPFSLSAAPDGRSLRFTVKALGDDSSFLQAVPIGTRVLAEGPYGAFTAARASRGRKVALIGGGIGITPIRALFEDIDRQPGEVSVMYRARNRNEAIFHDDLVAMGRRRGFDVLISYSRAPGKAPGGDPFAPDHLQAAIPDLADREVFVCGPPSLIAAASGGLRRAGVPADQIHSERFDY